MIKIELSREGLEINVSGIEPIVYAEAGFMLSQLYRCLRKSSGEESAKKMIRDLAENCILSDAEQKEKHQRNKDTPEGRAASELINKFFGGARMKQIDYETAINQLMVAGNEEIQIAVLTPMKDVMPLEIRRMANEGAVFFIPDNQEAGGKVPPPPQSRRRQSGARLTAGK